MFPGEWPALYNVGDKCGGIEIHLTLRLAQK